MKGKDSIGLACASKGKGDVFYLLVLMSIKKDWSQYYQVYREILAHWANREYNLLGTELPEELAP